MLSMVTIQKENLRDWDTVKKLLADYRRASGQDDTSAFCSEERPRVIGKEKSLSVTCAMAFAPRLYAPGQSMPARAWVCRYRWLGKNLQG